MDVFGPLAKSKKRMKTMQKHEIRLSENPKNPIFDRFWAVFGRSRPNLDGPAHNCLGSTSKIHNLPKLKKPEKKGKKTKNGQKSDPFFSKKFKKVIKNKTNCGFGMFSKMEKTEKN